MIVAQRRRAGERMARLIHADTAMPLWAGRAGASAEQEAELSCGSLRVDAERREHAVKRIVQADRSAADLGSR
jgi:hypothetical protein